MTHDEIAEVCRVSSGSNADAVVAHFSVSRRYAFRLIKAAREAGHDIPGQRKGPKPGTGATTDRVEVAKVALAAVSGSMSLAVSEHFGITRKLASSLIHKARKDGHQIPVDLAKPGAGALYDRAEVAAIALANPGRMTAAVSARFDISRTHASSLIDRARKAGFEIPRERAMPETRVVDRSPSITGLSLVCECGVPCGMSFPDLLRHTTNVHGRIPSRVERIPQDTRKVAA